ncbi:hypothetical protein KY289_005365 [Solanum tuberosum]|nr:hypothetical protein KY289_005365 [Solanum tuberosum]
MESANGRNSSNTQFGVEKLVGTNYKYWTMYGGLPSRFMEKMEDQMWYNTFFPLRTSIGKELIDHVRDVSSSKEVWEIIERLFTKKNIARLQLLENELAMLTLGGMSIAEYFL